MGGKKNQNGLFFFFFCELSAASLKKYGEFVLEPLPRAHHVDFLSLSTPGQTAAALCHGDIESLLCHCVFENYHCVSWLKVLQRVPLCARS